MKVYCIQWPSPPSQCNIYSVVTRKIFYIVFLCSVLFPFFLLLSLFFLPSRVWCWREGIQCLFLSKQKTCCWKVLLTVGLVKTEIPLHDLRESEFSVPEKDITLTPGQLMMLLTFSLPYVSHAGVDVDRLLYLLPELLSFSFYLRHCSVSVHISNHIRLTFVEENRNCGWIVQDDQMSSLSTGLSLICPWKKK